MQFLHFLQQTENLVLNQTLCNFYPGSRGRLYESLSMVHATPSLSSIGSKGLLDLVPPPAGTPHKQQQQPSRSMTGLNYGAAVAAAAAGAAAQGLPPAAAAAANVGSGIGK